MLERFQNDPLYRGPLTNIGWDENIARHDIRRDRKRGPFLQCATRGERSGNENSWRLVLKAEGANGPLDQKYDYKEAKETCNKLCKESAAT